MNDSSRTSLPASVLLMCLLVSVVAAAVAYGVGHVLPKTYQNSGTIRIGVPTQSGIADTNVQASNDLASQYVQLVNSEPVAAIAAKFLGVSPEAVKGHLTGSVVGAQNILQVAGTGSSASQATARSDAGVRAVRSYLIRLTSDQNEAYVQGLVNRVVAATKAINRSASSPVTAQTQSDQNSVVYQALRDAAGNQPTFQIVNLTTGGATVTNPQPKLYAIVVFIVVLLLSLRIAFIMKRPTIS